MKTFLVVNPHSANGQTGRRWPEVHAELVRGLEGPFQVGFTERPNHASQLARQALHEGYGCVVAVGGDGTLNEVVNGFFEEGRPVNPEASLAVIPRGTGGDFQRSFEWGQGLSSAVARVRSERTAPLDLGKVELTGKDGRPVTRYFANVCSFGVSGLVVHEVNRTTKAFGGKLSFMVGTVRALLKYSDRKLRVRFDDGPEESLDVTALAVANGRFFGGGMMVAPDANPSDGLLDVTIWSGFGVADFAFKAASLYDGSHVRWPGTRRLRVRSLTADCDTEVLMDVDGEQPGRLPCRISLAPSAVRLKV